MSKRLTSLLIGAFAVLLLGAPAQAQVQKVIKTKASKAIAAYCQQLKLKVDLATSVEFRKLSQEQQAQVVKEAEARIKKNASREYAPLPHAAMADARQFSQQGTPVYGKQFSRRSANTPLMAPRKAGEAADENGIITSPAEGEHKFYTREGMAYYYSGQLQMGPQSGLAEIVECADGTIYFKDIVSHYATGAWVKGTKTGNTITFAAGQPVSYNSNYGTTLSVNWGEGNSVDRVAGDITFEIDGDVIRLVGSSEEKLLAVHWDDDNTWSGNGDYDTVLTLDPTYIPPTLITPPDGLETQTCKLTGAQYTNTGAANYSTNVEVGIDGNDYYIKGMFKAMPNAWIKGTLTDGVVVFPKLQYLGNYGGSYEIYLLGVTWLDDQNYQLDDFKMAYDEETTTLTSLNDVLANASQTEIYYLSWLGEISIPLTIVEEAVATTGEPVDELPYINKFDTEADQAAFGAIDSNDDGSTWYFSDGTAYYTYAEDAANDWLVSPAIYLEAGKNYHFSIDAASYWAAYFPERMEVKMGKAPKASELKQEVIPPTDLLTDDLVPYENELVTVSETGYYHFGIHAISDANMYHLLVDNFLVEPSALPTAPNEVTDLTVESTVTGVPGAIVKFNAPTTALNDESLTENLTKIEIYRDGQLIATLTDIAPGQEVVYEDNDPALTVGNHTYQVIPYNADGIGKKSAVVTAHISVQLAVPYFADFSAAGVLDQFGVIDANGDGTTWAWNTSGYAAVSYNQLEQADDYIVTMPIAMKAGKTYNINASISTGSTTYVPEAFEIVIGNAPTLEALTTVIVPETNVYQTTPMTYSGSFTCEADGNYYVAVHGISQPDMMRLQLFSLSVMQELTAESLRAPRLSVQPDPYGLDKAVVTLTAPAMTMDGTKLTENIGKIVLYRNGMAYKTFENVKPGDIKVFVEENINGAYKYMAVPFDNDGNHGQATETVSVFVGLDVPASPTNIVAQETVNGVIFSWDPVTTGANGGIIVPSEVTYTVYSAHQEQGWFGPQWVLDEAVAVTTDTKAEIELDNSVEQATAAFFIAAKNELGEGSASGNLCFVGQPWQMPLEEHFGQTFNYSWVYNASEGVGVAYSQESSDDDNSSVEFSTPMDDGQSGYFQSGKIAMREGNPTLIVDVKGTGAAKNRFAVRVVDANGKTHALTSVPVTEDWKTLKVSLADFANDPFIKVELYCDLKGAGSIVFDNMKITDLLEYNLAAILEAPKSIKAGETAKVNVTVKNIGERPVKDYTVKILAGENELLNQKVSEDLASFGTKTFAADLVTTIFDKAEDITLRAEVEYALELDDEDNTAEQVISIKQSTAAQPENVVAQKNGNDVNLSWNAPSSSNEEATEDFEDTEAFPAFGIGGIDANNRYGAFGSWTLYDGNNCTVYGFNGATFENSGEIQAWQVLNPNLVSANFASTYVPHSGNQFLISFCPADEVQGTPAADHWIISPALPGVAQTISFWYRAITDQYGAETFEVWYSTTDNKVESFTKAGSYNTTATEWTQMSVDLPAGTTYFAIRHTAKDIFGLLLDDITYTRGGGNVSKYNVYVDRELYDDTTGTSMVVKNTTAKSFAVSAVYGNGQESMPVEVILNGANQEPTSIEELTGRQQPVDVYSLDGKLVRQQTTTLQGLKGAYIIEGQKVIVK